MNLAVFDWDEVNIRHIARHGMTLEEFEKVVQLLPYEVEYQVVNGEERYLQIGLTRAGRLLTAVSTARAGRIRPVTAFPSTRRQREVY